MPIGRHLTKEDILSHLDNEDDNDEIFLPVSDDELGFGECDDYEFDSKGNNRLSKKNINEYIESSLLL